jgi:glycosyltransferase involved in cell wall biosynthesis
MPVTSQVVYNQVAPAFKPKNVIQARKRISFFIQKASACSLTTTEGYLLHIGSNIWYKNKRGVLEIYEAWTQMAQKRLPLIMIGDKPDPIVLKQIKNKQLRNEIVFLQQMTDDQLADAYAGASVLLFPSLEEGFGWPIAEAMASGCPVITTNKAPMTEVGGNAAFYIPRRPEKEEDIPRWSETAALKVNEVLAMSSIQRKEIIEAGLNNIQRFKSEQILDEIEQIYQRILMGYDAIERLTNQAAKLNSF